MKCGRIISWKRAKHSFGFVNYKEPEGALRCISIVNGLKIKNKTILVTADTTIIKILESYERGLKTKRFPLSKLYDHEKKSVEQCLAAQDAACLLKIEQLLEENDLIPRSCESKTSIKRTKHFERFSIQGKIKQYQCSLKKQNLEKKIKSKTDRVTTTQDLINIIPRNEKETFSFSIDWDFISESNIIEKIMRFWIKARLLEYPSQRNNVELTDVIVELLKKGIKPEKLINQLPLQKNTRSFVIKMWRRLIFETMKMKFNLK